MARDAAPPIHAAAPEFLRRLDSALRVLMLLAAPLLRLSPSRAFPPRPSLVCDAPGACPHRHANARSPIWPCPGRQPRPGRARRRNPTARRAPTAPPRSRGAGHTPATGPPATRARACTSHA
jgi:hypothetical protein